MSNVSIELPTYYGVVLSVYVKDGEYYMSAEDYGHGETKISQEFYQAAVKEFTSPDFEWGKK